MIRTVKSKISNATPAHIVFSVLKNRIGLDPRSFVELDYDVFSVLNASNDPRAAVEFEDLVRAGRLTVELRSVASGDIIPVFPGERKISGASPVQAPAPFVSETLKKKTDPDVVKDLQGNPIQTASTRPPLVGLDEARAREDARTQGRLKEFDSARELPPGPLKADSPPPSLDSMLDAVHAGMREATVQEKGKPKKPSGKK